MSLIVSTGARIINGVRPSSLADEAIDSRDQRPK
jgi:hypothetical protein